MPETIALSRYEWRLLWTLLDIWLRTDRQIEFCEADTKELVALNGRISHYLEPDHALLRKGLSEPARLTFTRLPAHKPGCDAYYPDSTGYTGHACTCGARKPDNGW